MNPTLLEACSFAKVFALDDGQQLAVYRDTHEGEPVIVMTTWAFGVRANTVLDLNAQQQSSAEHRRAVMDEIFNGIDCVMAGKVVGILRKTLQEQAPVFEAIDAVKTMIDGPSRAVGARFQTLANGQRVLLVRDDDTSAGDFGVVVVDNAQSRRVTFATEQARHAAMIGGGTAFEPTNLKPHPGPRC